MTDRRQRIMKISRLRLGSLVLPESSFLGIIKRLFPSSPKNWVSKIRIWRSRIKVPYPRGGTTSRQNTSPSRCRSARGWFRKKPPGIGAQKLRSEAHLEVRYNDGAAAQSRSERDCRTFPESIKILLNRIFPKLPRPRRTRGIFF